MKLTTMKISKAASVFVLLSGPISTQSFVTKGVPAHSTASTFGTASPRKNGNGRTKTIRVEAYIDTAESAARNVPGFEEWASNFGVQRMDGVEIYSEDGYDWQAVTTVDIPAGSTVLFVPSEMVLRSSSVAAELESISPGGGVQAAVTQLGRIGSGSVIPEFYLFLKLLVEYERQEQSPYQPYLDMLPRLYYTAVSMTDFCYECLPPLVFSLSRAERVKFDNFCQVLAKVDVISNDLKQDKDVLKWAFNSVFTRAAYNKEGQPIDDIAIAPMADMFNHGTETEIEIAFDEAGNCVAYTTTDVPANSALRTSYGDPTNPSLLFARYGFLDESSPATFCKIMDIPKTPDNVAMGMDFSKMLFFKDTGDISQEVMDVVLYAKVLSDTSVHPDALAIKQQFYEAHMMGDMATKQAIHDQFRYETACVIKKHVDTFLRLLSELSNKSIGKSYDEHPRLPLILTHNEFVKKTFLNVKDNLDAFVTQYERQYA